MPPSFILCFLNKDVGRESKVHPAFCIILSLDAKRYHLPPIQGYKYRFKRNGGAPCETRFDIMTSC